MQDINIEEIMQEIRETVNEKSGNVMLNFDDISIDRFEELYDLEWECDNILGKVGQMTYIPWKRDLFGNFLSRCLKKVIRKMTKFLIAPMSTEQNQYNEVVIQVLNRMEEIIYKQNEILQDYQKRLLSLESQIKEEDRS